MSPAGPPLRSTLLPYGRHHVTEEEIGAVADVLRSAWLTTGPKVPEFEAAFAAATGTRAAAAVSSGTAALHAAFAALDIRPGDEVVVPAMTFAATSNAVLYLGATPVFADVDPTTLLVRPEDVERAAGPRTKAIVAVDYAGQPCDWDALREIGRRHQSALVADACHALGGALGGRPVGSLADLSCFSLHPVKQITTGEGGMVTTDDPDRARRVRVFRNHGITTDHRERAQSGTVFYDMVTLGFNYRMTDFQAALGIGQLSRLTEIVARRQVLAAMYRELLAPLDWVQPLALLPGRAHAYHLFVVRIDGARSGRSQGEVLAHLRAANIGANVHYRPPHLHPYYRERLGTHEGLCPVAEKAAGSIVSLPLFPEMTAEDVRYVADVLGQLS